MVRSGSKQTPDAFVAELVTVFREVRRVLRDDGTLWLNIGDSYAGSWGNQGRKEERGTQRPINGGMLTPVHDGRYPTAGTNTGAIRMEGVKPKDLYGVPWLLAFALRADGWHLRQDIIWSKPNPMPESVKDRCTKAHEYVFLLSKSPRYYYNAEAISEPAVKAGQVIHSYGTGEKDHAGASDVNDNRTKIGLANWNQPCPDTRNKRSVWEIATQPFGESHFATMPPDLAETCILAGCPEGGTVLDPFGGAGTTGLVADRWQRNAVLVELNPDYAAMAERRITLDAPLFAEVEA